MPTGVQALYRLWRGQLRGGGELKGYKLAIKGLTEAFPGIPGLNNQSKAAYLVRRAWFDPELAQHLLTAPVKEAEVTPWRTKLLKLTGPVTLGVGARENLDDGEPAKNQDIPTITVRPGDKNR